MGKGPNPTASETLAADLARSFTSQKLEWLKCVMSDADVPPRTFEVAFCIVQHVNAGKGYAYVSDETIADETGSCIRDVQRARNTLRDTGWLKWKRTGEANVYTPLYHKMSAALDAILVKRDLRQERREGRRCNRTQMSDWNVRHETPESERDLT
jgi:hypothetical protein